jgi:hypothetical protein
MTTQDPAKRIPKSLGTEATLFGTYTLTDVAVALLPGVIVALAVQVAVPSSLQIGGYLVREFTLPATLLAIAVGGLFVYLTPPYITSTDWIATLVRYRTRPSQLSHLAAREFTHIEQAYPNHDAIERSDGAIIGLVQVVPPSMALATDAEWAATAIGFRDLLNTVVDFPVQLYSTTTDFPIDEYLDRYEQRLTDPDVESNPRLQRLIEHYIDWYRDELAERQTTIREHYVVVPVTPREVQFSRESLSDKLASLPVIGVFVQAWFTQRHTEQQAAMFETLDTRCRRLQRGFRELDGCDASRVDTASAARLIGEFWTGESLDDVQMERRLRSNPVVGESR